MAAVRMMKQSDQVGERHADPGVRQHAPELLIGLRGSLLERRLRGVRALLFHFFRGLPEEQIGADGGPEDRDQGGQGRPGPRKTRKEGRLQDADPRDLDHEQNPDVGQEGHAQPFQVGHITVIGDEDLEPDAEQAETYGVGEERASDHQVEGRRHGANVGTEVDGVGQDQ